MPFDHEAKRQMKDVPVKLEQDVVLRPVLELEPGSFANMDSGLFELSVPSGSEAYWRACLKEAGITGLDPIREGSWFVFADALTDKAVLAAVLDAHLEEEGIPDDLEEIGAFTGGFALIHAGQLVLEPTCCGDLGNLYEWAEAVNHSDDTPADLWIGHPWLSVWLDEGWLYIKEQQEYGLPTDPRTICLRPAQLQEAVQRAESFLEQFSGRLEPVVRSRADAESSRTSAICSLLLGR